VQAYWSSINQKTLQNGPYFSFYFMFCFILLAIFMCKMLGDSTAALLQGVIVFAFGFILGVPFDPLTLVVALPIMLLITFGLVSVGLTIASFIGSLENFGAIQTFINLPCSF